MSDSHPAAESIPAAPAVSLDPVDWAGFREQAHRMLDDMLDYTENLRSRPVWQPTPNAVRARFDQPLPTGPAALAQVHQEFMESILPYTAANAHPGFMGWVQGGGTPVGMLAEMLAAGLNANVGGRDQMPLAVERQVTEWMRRLFDFPAGASGLFVTGTSVANFLAVVVARDARLGGGARSGGVPRQGPRLTAYASAAAHGCLARALDLAGLGSNALRLVAVDSRLRIDLAALAEMLAADRAAGFTPFLVIGTAGTVDTGAIDDLEGLAAVCALERLWFHVDGAFGALARLAPSLAPRLAGIERADSLAFDFHKWAQVPYDAGFLLVRDGGLHRQAFAVTSPYLQREARGLSGGSPWPCDYGVDLSRSFRALKTWCTLKVYGTDAIAAVIEQTCALARYLESRIAAEPQLELMAPVELNIVCFRFSAGSPAEPLPGERLDILNRQIAIEVQESGRVAPSATVLGGRVALRAAIVNHRTARSEVDTLVEAVLTSGRALAQKPVRPMADAAWQPSVERAARLSELDAALERTLALEWEVSLRVERAGLLARAGRMLEARSDHFRVLMLAPENLANLVGLGRLFISMGQLKAARVVYTEAVKYHPGDLVSRVNLGGVLLESEEPAAARAHYQAALAIDPEFPQAHGGMYYALSKLRETDAAEEHRRRAFGQKNLFVSPYRGDEPPVPILLLVSSVGGNAPVEKLLDDRIFQTFVVVADFYNPDAPLPEHRLVVNGIGDADLAGHSLAAAEMLLAGNTAPVLNPPARVLATTRCENARRLAGLPGVVTARTACIPHACLAGSAGPVTLAQRGFTYPLLLRVPGMHMGRDFVRVEGEDALAAALAELPAPRQSDAPILAIEYLDAQGKDGHFRKYRVMMIAGRLYPLHLAISGCWKVHYFSADMADRPEHRAEEARFLSNMTAVLGARAMEGLQRIEYALGLDYAGVDFGLNAEGDILLFEANATMVFAQPDPDQRWDYRRAAVKRIEQAVSQMLQSRSVESQAAQ